MIVGQTVFVGCFYQGFGLFLSVLNSVCLGVFSVDKPEICWINMCLKCNNQFKPYFYQ